MAEASSRPTFLGSKGGLARDEAIALSPAMRASHPESTAASAGLTSTEVCTPASRRERGWSISRMPKRSF
jgi:hypothetical protein